MRLKHSIITYVLSICLLLIIAVDVVAQDLYKETRENVGDIPFDPLTDNLEFELIDENTILPYNTLCGFLIEGERYGILDYFGRNFKADTIKEISGYITIRFIVNHKGKTDRFRIYEMDNNYNPVKFPANITDSLLTLTKKIEGWITSLPYKLNRYNGIETEHEDGTRRYTYDYYQYILFKIKDGQIETILP